MCLIVLFTRHLADCPLLLGANREERYARPSARPRWLGGRPDVFAGQDRLAGGTWLGVNEAGVVAAVTNRRPGPEAPVADTRSRGLLCLEALRHANTAAAVAWCERHLQDQAYHPFNLLLADDRGAFVVRGGGPPEIVDVAPGLHFLGKSDVDDLADSRLARARGLVCRLEGLPTAQVVDGLQAALADTDPDVGPRQRLCRHGDAAGTVSSTVIALPGPGCARATFHHAPGPPDRTPFADLSADLRGGPPGPGPRPADA